MINIQYIVYDDELYVIEVNPRSSRTVPYISKVTGVPIDRAGHQGDIRASRCRAHGLPTPACAPKSGSYAVKVPVFSFEKLHDAGYQPGAGDEVHRRSARCISRLC